ncbi:ABC transporter ATP-binding protein [Mycoplasma bradburyae]|uniref:ABC transporter ATP-binding protein/permease n=1 Tax=Mycoplasma bradburyae TaxID=2963128 RepID=A0AAW6HR51_9MOLU|nr:ABC transporter ATP-binding protein [Mycoplasma bradburyae]MDC4183206.1 ABC transporter ATP-binding protein/permease [Mycoplasma bradburyae]UTS70858.1 ABC transporter ATP-binding protein/permease [Mycoplasma bradburyae]
MLKILLYKATKSFKFHISIVPFFLLIESLTTVLVPYFISDLINYGIIANDKEALTKYSLILLGIAVVGFISGFIGGRSITVASVEFAKQLRVNIFTRFQSFSAKNIDKFDKASVLTRTTTDINYIQTSIESFRMAIRGFSVFLCALILMFITSWKLGVSSLVVIPIILLGIAIVYRLIIGDYKKVFREYDELNNLAKESISGMRVVKSYHQQDSEIKKFNRVTNFIYKNFTKIEKISALIQPIVLLCIYSLSIAIAWFGTKDILAGSLNIGDLTSVLAYAFQMLINLLLLTFVYVTIITAKPSKDRIIEILTEKIDIKNKQNPIKTIENFDVEFKNVSFKYIDDNPHYNLENINIKIKQGQTIGIIGPTGSGKTSIVNLLSRLYESNEGQVLINNIPVNEYSLETLRETIGIVPQKNILYSGTIKENILMGKDYSDDDINKAISQAQAKEFINKLPNNVDSEVEQNGANFSGGQKQRICIARAMIKKPKILVFDDSTSALDTKTDALIQESFNNDFKESSKILISQRISSIKNADEIYVLNNGKVVANGTHDYLIQNCELYREINISQTEQ